MLLLFPVPPTAGVLPPCLCPPITCWGKQPAHGLTPATQQSQRPPRGGPGSEWRYRLSFPSETWYRQLELFACKKKQTGFYLIQSSFLPTDLSIACSTRVKKKAFKSCTVSWHSYPDRGTGLTAWKGLHTEQHSRRRKILPQVDRCLVIYGTWHLRERTRPIKEIINLSWASSIL